MFSVEEAQLIADCLHAVARNQGLDQPEDQRTRMKGILAKLQEAEKQRIEAEARLNGDGCVDPDWQTYPAIKDHDGENPIGMA